MHITYNNQIYTLISIFKFNFNFVPAKNIDHFAINSIQYFIMRIIIKCFTIFKVYEIGNNYFPI